MSKGTLGQVVKRAISDAAFRRQLQSDPEGALKGFDLTSEERAALRSGDASKLSTFGVDQRMSKAFTLGEGAAAASRAASGSELSNSSAARSAFIDQEGPAARSAFIDQDSAASNVRISDAGGSVRAGITSEGTGGRTALGDQHDGGRAAIGDSASGGARAGTTDGAERLAQVNASFEGGDSAASGRNALGDQHDIGRAAISDTAAGGREGTAYITADEAGNNVVAGGSAGAQSSLDVSGQTRVTSASTDAASGREGDAFMTADEMGNDVSASGSSHPSLSADQRLAGETLEADITPTDTAGDPWVENPEHQG